jgi:uncharacterized protein (DUF983 family)
MKTNKKKEEDIPVVDVIASGYEWICPACDTFHKIIEFPKNPIRRCSNCQIKVELNYPEHALGG